VSTLEKLHKLKNPEDLKLWDFVTQLDDAYGRATESILIEVKILSRKSPSSKRFPRYLPTHLVEKISEIFLLDEGDIIEFMEECLPVG
jgi:hypothetical protein